MRDTWVISVPSTEWTFKQTISLIGASAYMWNLSQAFTFWHAGLSQKCGTLSKLQVAMVLSNCIQRCSMTFCSLDLCNICVSSLPSEHYILVSIYSCGVKEWVGVRQSFPWTCLEPFLFIESLWGGRGGGRGDVLSTMMLGFLPSLGDCRCVNETYMNE